MKLESSIVTLKKNIDTLNGIIIIPPSKSETNRAIIIGALHEAPFTIYHPSECIDSQVFMEYLYHIGIQTKNNSNSTIIVGNIHDTLHEQREINLKDAGTAMRFLVVLSAFINGTTILRGSKRLMERPIKNAIDVLINQGIKITYLNKVGHLPIKIQGNPNLLMTDLNIDTSQTSQILSAFLLIGSLLPLGTNIHFDTNITVSIPYIELTTNMLKNTGIHWNFHDNKATLSKNTFDKNEIIIGGDWSSASYWFGLASTSRSNITIKNLDHSSAQGDKKILELFRKLGLTIHHDSNSITLINEHLNKIPPFQFNFQYIPDVALTFGITALFSWGECKLTGLETLNFKESNRINALVNELDQLGIKTNSDYSTITVFPSIPEFRKPIKTYEDHRVAMSFAILANYIPEIAILQPHVVSKSYPNFWNQLQEIGFNIKHEQIT